MYISVSAVTPLDQYTVHGHTAYVVFFCFVSLATSNHTV